MSENPSPSKHTIAEQILRTGSLFIHLDPRLDQVKVPSWLRHQAQLVLQIGLDMPIPIPDLRVDEDGIYGTLSFSRTPFACNVPWGAVFALVGDEGRGMVWPESMPAEIVAEVEREVAKTSLSKLPPKLTPTPMQKLAGGNKAPTTRPEPKKKGKLTLPPYLRVVK